MRSATADDAPAQNAAIDSHDESELVKQITNVIRKNYEPLKSVQGTFEETVISPGLKIDPVPFLAPPKDNVHRLRRMEVWVLSTSIFNRHLLHATNLESRETSCSVSKSLGKTINGVKTKLSPVTEILGQFLLSVGQVAINPAR